MNEKRNLNLVSLFIFIQIFSKITKMSSNEQIKLKTNFLA